MVETKRTAEQEARELAGEFIMTLSESGSAQEKLAGRLLAYRKRVLEEVIESANRLQHKPSTESGWENGWNSALATLTVAIRALDEVPRG